MARVKVTGLERATKRIRTQVGQAIKKGGFEKEMQRQVVEEVRKNSISPVLTRAWVRRRDRLSTVNKTHPDFSAPNSNLTFTGQLLDSMFITFNITKFAFLFRAKGKHKQYRNLNKKKTKARRVVQEDGSVKVGITNFEIFQFQKDLGRSLAQLFSRDKFKQSLTQSLKKTIRDFFKS